jgi:hypothetical protein
MARYKCRFVDKSKRKGTKGGWRGDRINEGRGEEEREKKKYRRREK